MRYYRSAALLVSLAALSVIIPAAQAHPPAGAGAAKVAPFKSGGGVSAQEVAIASFTPSYTGEPVDACRVLGRKGKVLFSLPGSTCTVKPGVKVLVPLPGASCSDAEAAPFFGESAAEQRACALAIIRQEVLELRVSVDGRAPQNVLSDRFLTISDQFDVVSQPGNPFGATPGPTTLVAVGYLGVLRGLRPGHHMFVVSGVAFGGSFTGTWTVNVVPGAHH
jgi:hypothetical protein